MVAGVDVGDIGKFEVLPAGQWLRQLFGFLCSPKWLRVGFIPAYNTRLYCIEFEQL